MSAESDKKAEEFLKVADDFRLGRLPTESRHPLTENLAELSRTDIPAALRIFQDIDVAAIDEVITHWGRIENLRSEIENTFQSGGRVFFYGCGATGRLSLSIEYIWRSLHMDSVDADRVRGFMSGGDLALVHSIENFEDHPEYGARQVREIGFGENDLLVSCTEGGETPSVIGATEEAARISKRKPFFLFCNPEDVLRQVAERSARVFDNTRIEKICLSVGAMALSGSTRLQASTVLMLAAGAALMGLSLDEIKAFRDFLARADWSFISKFTEAEASVYQAGEFVLYETNIYGMTMLTDTTERSPTFSLRAFENQNDLNRIPALCYFRLPDAVDAAAAWERILLRKPDTIEWDDLRAIAGRERIIGFDFSAQALAQREKLVAPHKLHRFSIMRENNEMVFSFGEQQHKMDVGALPLLCEHLFLKCLLNAHSTLVMGRLGRYESNVMTWVKPSNKKLIDRSIRYVEHLLRHAKIEPPSYKDVCHVLFEEAEIMKPDESVVMRTVERLMES